MENVGQRSVERHSIVRRALFTRRAVTARRRSLLIPLPNAIRSAVLRVGLLDWPALTGNTPAAVVSQALNWRVRSVIAAFRDELDFGLVGDGVRSR